MTFPEIEKKRDVNLSLGCVSRELDEGQAIFQHNLMTLKYALLLFLITFPRPHQGTPTRRKK